MAMTAGSKPTGASSSLSGLANAVYQAKLSEGIYKPESAIVVGDQTETETNRANRVFKAKLSSWIDANSLITYMTANAEVSVSVSANMSAGAVTVSGTATVTSAPGVAPVTGSGTISGNATQTITNGTIS